LAFTAANATYLPFQQVAPVALVEAGGVDYSAWRTRRLPSRQQLREEADRWFNQFGEINSMFVRSLCPFAALAVLISEGFAVEAETRPRAREIGIEIGLLDPGRHNAITDVPGVTVGHETLNEGDSVRTGMTAIVPHRGNVFREKVPAAIVVGNGFGKLVGSTQVRELGTLETPIALTNTLSVFTAANGLVQYTLEQEGNEDVRSVNPVAGETNDGYLNDIRGRHVKSKHVLAAIANAQGGPVAEGCVGAGTGTRCMGFKGGIGTSSRIVKDSKRTLTVGVLVQSNFDGNLTIAGRSVGEKLGRRYRDKLQGEPKQPAGSCMIVLATDAPLDTRQLSRLARRCLLGLGAVGSAMEHGSGDYVIAFSTAESVRVTDGAGEELEHRAVLPDRRLTPLFQAAREATEEAIINSLLRAETTVGFRGRRVEAIPLEALSKALDEGE
jgi:D-aminopeptidase